MSVFVKLGRHHIKADQIFAVSILRNEISVDTTHGRYGWTLNSETEAKKAKADFLIELNKALS